MAQVLADNDMAMMIHSKWNKEQCSLKEGDLILLEE